jgi:hypothetical protein
VELSSGFPRSREEYERTRPVGLGALIAAYLDAVIRKDASAVDEYFDPNVEYMVNGTPSADPEGVLPPISGDCQ